MNTSPAAPTALVQGKSDRLMSLDALRGFDMFWIIGAGAIVRALTAMGDIPGFKFLAQQLTHKTWAGFAFYDLIFPMFVFIVGVSLVFSLSKILKNEGRAAATKRVISRGLLLVLVGIFYYGGFSNEWPGNRILGVLQRIGLAYLFAGLIFCWVPTRWLAGVAAGLLVGYWGLMAQMPIRDITLTVPAIGQLMATTGTTNAKSLYIQTTNFVTGIYEPGRNLANHVDYLYLPGRLNDTYWDPEGLLSTIPAVASCLLGVLAGLLLQSCKLNEISKVRWLAGFGVALVVVGFLWGTQFPVIKKIWSSSFVCVAGGYSCLFLATFYLIVDVWKFQAWCQPFVWVGLNPITVYLADNLLGFGKLAARFAGGDLKIFLNTYVLTGVGDLVVAVVGLSLAVLFCRFLFRRQIFIRL